MALFVATYTYASDSTALRDEVRARHRAWLHQQPTLMVSGPTAGEGDDGAVLVFEGVTAAAVEALLDHDPFATTGGIVTERRVVGWTPVSGRLLEHFTA